MEEGVLVLKGYRVRVFRFNKLLIGIPQDIGPRILYLAPMEKPDFNLLAVLPDISLETVDGVWRIHGGHRLWTAPESMPRTYSIDDKPVRIYTENMRVIIEGSPEHINSVQKKIVIEPGENDYSIKVTHVVVNIGRWPIEFACWAISVMRGRGTAIIPLKPKRVDKHGLLPDRRIALWPYTRLSDPRLSLLDTYIAVRHDPGVKGAMKVGAWTNPPLAAYYVGGYIFTKRIETDEKAIYPDHGSSVEVYVNDAFLELETLGPLRRVEPGEENVHVETWVVSRLETLELSESFLDNVFSKFLRV